MRFFLIAFVLILVSCQEIDQPDPCTAIYKEYEQMRSDFDEYLNVWIKLDRSELKHSNIQEWIDSDPEQRYQKMIRYMDEHAECLDFR